MAFPLSAVEETPMHVSEEFADQGCSGRGGSLPEAMMLRDSGAVEAHIDATAPGIPP